MEEAARGDSCENVKETKESQQSKRIFTFARPRFSSKVLRVVPLTVHTVRQAWVIINGSVKYDLSGLLAEKSIFPHPAWMRKYAFHSYLAFLTSYSVGTLVAHTVEISTEQTNGCAHNMKSKPKLTILITAIAVFKDYRRLKISKMLMDQLILNATTNKINKIHALVDESNAETVQFYNKFGFSTCSAAPFKETIESLQCIPQAKFAIMSKKIT